MANIINLGILDYVMVSLMLLVSAGTGIVFRFTGNRQKTMDEYLMGEKSSPRFLVVMSISVTITSAILMVGVPAEVYRYGSQYSVVGIAVGIGMVMSSYIFLPVYFQCNVTSIYEFLEIRFGKLTRYTVSALFILQMLLYMSSILYGPVLALSAVTNLSTKVIIVVCGFVCTFYCFLGGLKAILWTDAFQGISMFLCIIVICITGITEVGGIGEVIRRGEVGNRIQFFNMTTDLTTRYTFWNVFFRGLSLGVGVYGTNQIEVQRALSMSSCKNAQSALRWSAIPVAALFLTCNLFGVILYSVFYLCDPLQADSGLTKYDQLVPYFIVSRLHNIPGLTGLCFAGIFSGSLSSISSALNSLSTVTVVDFLKPFFPNRFTESKLVLVAKGLSLFYGTLCILLCFIISKAQSILQVVLILLSVVEGPTTAIFLIGVLTRKASDKCVMLGLIIGFAVSSWIGFGSLLSGHRHPILPLESIGCSNNSEIISYAVNTTLECSNLEKCPILQQDNYSSEIFVLYKLSFLWIPTFGCILTILLVFAFHLITGWNKNAIPSDSKCLSPIVRYWMKTESLDKKRGIPLEEKS
ncbi:sodium-coupled monocarboxylate transporter 1 [Nephila pilipes]|uniref:Sodium-coupled monocarboxylate transporter 1 n=1 Tax=Nephila pilipes TaxID=299642 RepID=A0A8X6NI41_NEPPI|nr:sodium-coupled monocarboxylate transporter 1 [Nephila pilipes]